MEGQNPVFSELTLLSYLAICIFERLVYHTEENNAFGNKGGSVGICIGSGFYLQEAETDCNYRSGERVEWKDVKKCTELTRSLEKQAWKMAVLPKMWLDSLSGCALKPGHCKHYLGLWSYFFLLSQMTWNIADNLLGHKTTLTGYGHQLAPDTTFKPISLRNLEVFYLDLALLNSS